MSLTLADFKRVQAEARKTMRALRKLYPAAFDAQGRAIVATLTLPNAGASRRATSAPPAERIGGER